MQTNPSSEFLVLDNVVLTQTELTMLVERSECLDRIHKLWMYLSGLTMLYVLSQMSFLVLVSIFAAQTTI
ncbi:hypothetical protein ACFQDN_22170 [Pseudomonas asuensis]